ncbi:MAG TPA: YicC/YloC family endoribonuclease [Polyangiaceae bacterium]|nr:YicC/YloC family endoribonuclease [Polyangiaceae bacterium]
MRSMTGFGAGDAPIGGGQLSLELRALNHRFVDVRVRLPPEISDQASFVEQLVREKLERGRIDVSVRLSGAALPPARFSAERARALHATLTGLKNELAPGSELTFSTLASFAPLLLEPAAADVDEVRRALTTALTRACEELGRMRATEGAELARELGERLGSARKLAQSIRERSGELVAHQRARLKERLERLLAGNSPLDSARLESEVALMADRSDITEELARLDSHFQQFGALLGAQGQVGRQLDFLLQEIARELNTTGAKSQDAPVAQLVVKTKVEVERMREQVQNVE